MAVDCDIVHKSGSWYTFGEERLGQGREAVKTHLEEHPDLREKIENLVRAEYDMPLVGDAAIEFAEEEPEPAL